MLIIGRETEYHRTLSLKFLSFTSSINFLVFVLSFQARKIRSDVESKLPDVVLCQKQGTSELTNIDTVAVRHKAELILNDLAKHLVALKASEGRLSGQARRSYLQVSHEALNESSLN